MRPDFDFGFVTARPETLILRHGLEAEPVSWQIVTLLGGRGAGEQDRDGGNCRDEQTLHVNNLPQFALAWSYARLREPSALRGRALQFLYRHLPRKRGRRPEPAPWLGRMGVLG
jgi:hypothetical protein